MSEKDVSELLRRYNAGECSEQEKELLESWYLKLAENGKNPSADRIDTAFKEVKAALPGNAPDTKMFTWRLGAAAAVIFVCALALYLFRGDSTPSIAKEITTPVRQSQDVDVLPGGNKAILTLSDGSTINLDQAHTGNLANQGATGISKTGSDELVYATSEAAIVPSEIMYNTITTPRGGQYHVVLPDGTRVWLNAASSIRFPTTFSEKTRKITLSGEAYFEVASDKSKPFIVSVSGSTIQVLGTHFNVMAYEDESLITTLLEGSVMLKHGKAAQKLIPGEAAIVENGISVTEVNTEDAIAWKNGLTVFTNSNIQSIMRQISRWYDIDVVYRGEVPSRLFTGRIPRNASLSKVLKVLELSDINFKIEEKTIIVTP